MKKGQGTVVFTEGQAKFFSYDHDIISQYYLPFDKKSKSELLDQTPLAGMPVRSTGRGDVKAFQEDSALFVAVFPSRLTNLP